MKLVNFEEGYPVIQKRTVVESIMFIVSGSLELYIEGGINDYSLDLLKPGSVIGAYSVVTETRFEFSARAQTNIQALLLSRDDLFASAVEHRTVAEAL